jgi:hypothetical protein
MYSCRSIAVEYAVVLNSRLRIARLDP